MPIRNRCKSRAKNETCTKKELSTSCLVLCTRLEHRLQTTSR